MADDYGAPSRDALDDVRQAGADLGDSAEATIPYEKAARWGYAAKGAVYVLIGVLALMAAFGSAGSGETTGSSGALNAVNQGPAGDVILGLLAVGLVGYVVWRMMQALVDPEDVSDDDWGWFKRTMYFVSGVAYALLAYKAVQLVLGSGGGSGGGGGGTESMTARLMEQPFGPWLVGIVGVAIAARGVSQAVSAYRESFFEKIRDVGSMSRDTVRRIGQLGLTARGAVFLMIGGFVVSAAINHDPDEARGLEGILDTMASTGGPWLLGAAGAGLLCYGLFQFVKARYRVIG